MRHTQESGMAESLTSSSYGLKSAVITTYGDGDYTHSEYLPTRYAMDEFKKQYPPLPNAMQDIVEDSLLGGFVWGSPGVHKGVFTHLDFSSSYPYEYYAGKMFKGRISIVKPDSPLFEDVMQNPELCKWVIITYIFNGIKECGLPLIAGAECDWGLGGKPPRASHAKMRHGTVSHKLYTLTYWQELQKHINVVAYTIHEVWVAKARTGEFSKFIEMCYSGKEKAKQANGGKNNIQSNEYKLLMNGGVHGKTITRTHRKKIIYNDKGEKLTLQVVNEPKYCSLIGFTGMMNARERLAKYCRLMKEAGYDVLMCDTDSMVVNATYEKCREIIGDWFTDYPKGDLRNIGRFEAEDFNGTIEFDEFRCWGLKRYMEMDHGIYRKSAFAGMNRKLQAELLPIFPTDGTEFSWKQQGAVMDKYGKMIKQVPKTAKSEGVWFEDLCMIEADNANRIEDVLREMNADSESEWGISE